MTHAVELPTPRDWQVFEDFCRDLFAAEWGDPDAQKHGRPGQEQHGVDVFGRRDGRWQAVQCKRRSSFPEKRLTAKEVRAEVRAAREFPQPLATLVIATTAPPDTHVQALASQLTEEHGEGGPRVVVYGWSDLCEKLDGHEDVRGRWQRKLLGAPPVASAASGTARVVAGSIVVIAAALLLYRGLRSPCESIVSQTASQLKVQVASLEAEGELILGAAKIQDLTELAQVTGLRLKTCCIALESGRIDAEQFQRCQQTHETYQGQIEELATLVGEAKAARQAGNDALYAEKTGAVDRIIERARATAEDIGSQQ